MLRRLSHCLTAGIIGISFSLITVSQEVWQTFTDEEAGFTISFPGRPTYEQTSLSQSGDPEEKYKFQYGEHFLSISFVPLLGNPRNSVELSQAYAEFTMEYSKNGTLIRQEKLPDGGRQYYNESNESAGRLHMLTRVHIRNGRSYQIVYGTFRPKGIDEQVAERFFSSFRFIDSQPRRLATARKRSSNGGTLQNVKRPKWYILQQPREDFVVEFPMKPEFSLTPQPEIGTEVYKFHCFSGENLFVLNYWEVPEAKTRPEQTLQRVVAGHIAGEDAKGQVLNELRLPDGGYEVESQGVINGLLLRSRVRFYVHGTRIYTLTTTTQNLTGPNKGDLDRFFTSFSLRKP